jgi:hypothetical protein
MTTTPIICCNNWKDLGSDPYYIPWMDGDGISYRDPVQGGMKNCCLIAALSSIALADPRKFLPQFTGTYKIILYNPLNLAEKYTYKVKPTVPLDNDNEFCYARSKNEWGELWPAIWEKAYAAFRLDHLGLESHPTNSTIDQIDYCLLEEGIDWGGIPTVALTTILGTASEPVITLKKKCTPILTNDQIINDIKAKCRQASEDSWIVSGKKLVTWTHSTDNACVTYDDSRLIPEHSYSIIGLKLIHDVSYMVLRNPYGKSNPTPNTESITWGDYNETFLALGANYGIIAVPIDEFVQAFYAYGWHS